MIKLLEGDCLKVMKNIPDNSVDMVLTDPPYFKVKKETWDNQWDKPEKFLSWLEKCVVQWERILKPNGSLYCFASSRMGAEVEILVKKFFNINNHIVWAKPWGLWAKAHKEGLRAFFPQTERIIFAEHYGADNMAKGENDKLRGFVFEPLRAYLKKEWERAGLIGNDANIACGTASIAGGHYFVKSQWRLPTKKHYESLKRYANKNGGQYLRREYEDLRREYEDLRRPFTVTAKVPYTDVWTFEPVKPYKNKHPCEKPQDLLSHIINSSTRENAVILDCFMGTGSTAKACSDLNRNFIGIELDKNYFQIAKKRIENNVGLFNQDEEIIIGGKE